MMKKISACWCLALLLSFSTGAQTFKPGSSFPGFTSTEVLNYSSDTLHMADFKGKLIILDFWNLFCLSCIRAFPKLDSLQKKFGDRIQIILVNRESKEATREFFAKRKKIKMPGMPLVTNDKVLKKQFPHSGVPFTIWIDSEGTVRYYAYGYNLSEESLNSFLKGDKLAFQEYKLRKSRESLFDTAYNNAVEYYSYISRWINGVSLTGGRNQDYDGLGKGGSSIEELYKIAYSEGDKYKFYKKGRVILEVKEPSHYKYPTDRTHYDQWREKYAYNYFLRVPRNKPINKYELMKKDLEAYFGLKASIEYRKLLSWVLVETGKKELPVSKGGARKFKFYKENIKQFGDTIRSVRNYPLKSFAEVFGSLLEYYTLVPFADATHFTGNIDLDINGKPFDDLDFEGLRKELNRYGLDLIKMEWPHQVLVLRE